MFSYFFAIVSAPHVVFRSKAEAEALQGDGALFFRTHRKVEVVEKTQEKTGKLTDARIHSDTYTIKIMRIGQRPELKNGSKLRGCF